MKRVVSFVASTAIAVIASTAAQPADLPTPCAAGSCGVFPDGTLRPFVSSGDASAISSGNTLRIDQRSDRATLNWKNFDIGPDGRVIFNQPGTSSIALNRIFQGSPSRIFGALEANGQVYLINQNGFLFGATARVKTAGLLAATLNISDETFAAGLLAPELLQNGKAALESDGRVSVLDENGNPTGLEIEIVVDPGAQIGTNAPGSRVMLASRKVTNGGRIEAPDGQVLLAAGEKIYLQASSEPTLRGLLVEVEAGGEAWNRLGGEISAARGNVTMVGLAVNQEGRVSATTSVSSNGSVKLLGRDTVTITNGAELVAHRGGTVRLGSQSVTSVLPELSDTATAVDDQVQNASTVDINARQIVLKGGSRIVAPGGEVTLTAQLDPSTERASDPDSRIRMESGALIDVAGSTATLAVERNMVTVELRANELRDSPLQRDGPLRGKRVTVDARVGTPLADVAGALAAIPKTVAERTSAGGKVVFNSQGDVVVANGAQIDVSGGFLNYQPGIIQTTQLMGADGKVVDIGAADPDRPYIAAISPTVTRRFEPWGVTEVSEGPTIGRFDPGYVEGRAAGAIQFAAPTLVLNGDFTGRAVAGRLQRDAARAPAGGRFIIGVPGGADPDAADYRAPSVTLVSAPPVIVVGENAPLHGPRTLELPTDFLTRGGFGALDVFSNGVFSLPESMPLDLAPGTSINVLAQRIDIRSDIISHGGSILLQTDRTAGVTGTTAPRAGIVVDPGVTLDVSGLWTNDTQVADAPVYRNAGTIDLTARSFTGNTAELVVGSDVRLLANGGAWLQANGSLSAGNGGRIALRSGQLDSAFEVGERVALEAFGVRGAKGGSLALEAGRIEIGSGIDWAAGQRFDPAEPQSAALLLGESLFADHGFGSFEITATGESLEGSSDTLVVKSGARIDARTDVLLLANGLGGRASGGTVAGFSSRVAPQEFQRTASTVTLRTDPREFTDAARVGRVHVEEGAMLLGPARSVFNFSSSGGLLFEGSVLAAGGAFNATVPVPSTALDVGYVPDLFIDITSTATIDLSGAALLRPSDTGLRVGEVLAGGAVKLRAERGSIAIRDGARVDVSGAAEDLDLRIATSPDRYLRQRIASAAGSIDMLARESILLQGDLRAHAGVGSGTQAPGGSLTLQLTRNRDFVPGSGLDDTYPQDLRTVRVVQHAIEGEELLRNGLAIVEVDRIAASGVEALTLEGGDRVSFDPGVDLSLARSLVIESPAVELNDAGRVALAAPYLAFGSTALGAAPAAAAPGDGRLEMHGELLDLIGNVALRGVAATRFESSGDLRLRGFQDRSTSVGSLSSTGDVTLAASRIYPTTLTSFTVEVSGGPTNALRIEQTGAASGAPLSAAGSLLLRADRIEQGGTLLAPFGKISLAATQGVDLLAGSLTSVSGEGALIPFGRVQFGTEWYYSVGQTIVPHTAIPERNVDLEAPDVNIAAGSTVDLRGGGDLYAYTWLPGTGGSRDALLPGVTPGLYAVLPGLREQYAPYDPQESFGSDLKPGDSVYLSGVGDLPAGIYPLLPARYALLPGAYLVQAVSGYTDLQPGTPSSLLDGTPVIAGYRTFGTTGLGDTRFSGFAVHPASYGRLLATYEDFKASTFFPAQAQRLELPRPPIPADAGSLSLAVSNRLTNAGEVLVSPVAGGRGASIDIAAAHLQITNAPGEASVGIVQIDAQTLQRWNPASLLLGGRRHAAGSEVDVEANVVEFLGDAHLSLDEILAVATEKVSLEAGAQIESRAMDPTVEAATLRLTGAGASDAAVIAVSDRSVFNIERPLDTSPETGGVLSVAAGARLASHGALLLDAPNGGSFEGTLDGQGAAWSIGSRRIAFGESPIPDGFAITSALLSRMQQGSAIDLFSSGSIDFLAPTRIGAPGSALDRLSLAANAIQALGPAANVELAAKSILLRGVGTVSAPSAISGTSALQLNADEVRLLPGALAVGGFATTRVSSAGRFIAEGVSSLHAAGALELAAGRVTTTTAADAQIRSDGLLSVARSGADPGAQGRPSLGGAMTLSGRNVEVSGGIVMPSGSLTLRADENLSLLQGGLLDVGGIGVSAAGRSVMSPGGFIELFAGTDVSASSGAAMTLSGPGGADAGSLVIRAGGVVDVKASLAARADAGAGARGGSVLLEARSLRDFGAFNALLEAGGFAERRSVYVKEGDLTLAAGETATARNIEWTTDAGRIRVAGTITAHGADQRSSIGLFGGGGVTLASGGRLIADDGGSALGRGGRITLGSSQGEVALNSGSSVDTHGASENGRVLLRAMATTPDANGVMSDVAIAPIGASFTGVNAITVEPVLAFDVAQDLDLFSLDAYRLQAEAFVNAAATAIGNRIAPMGVPPILIQPGIELRRQGDLNLGTATDAINLAQWRFAGEPAALTFRATGSISINGEISDGFIAASAVRDDVLAGRSATLRFAAGSQLTSANPLAVANGAAADLTINGARVRTGTGDLFMAASRDILFSGAGASVYTGGNAGAPSFSITQGPLISFATGGGSLLLNAGRDVVGSAVTQAVGQWQPRTGRDNPANPTRWGVGIRQFAWNAGTLGGGDLVVRAGRDVRELAAAAADSALEQSANTITQFRGGTLSIDAGRDVTSSMLHVTAGVNRVRAGGAIGKSRELADDVLLGSAFSIQDAQVDALARLAVDLESSFNPTILAQFNPMTAVSFFYTYGEQSALRARSVAGDVTITLDKDRLVPFIGPDALALNSAGSLTLLPPNVTLASLSGDVRMSGSQASMFASDSGQLDLFAARDVDGSELFLVMSDAAASSLPTPIDPQINAASLTELQRRAASARHIGDPLPVMIAAGRDIVNGFYNLPKAAHVVAGRDVFNFSLLNQNLRADDRSMVMAGRSVVFGQGFTTGEFQVGGPGRFDVIAGRDVDLGFSRGISTTGRFGNPAITNPNGADVTVLVGMQRDLDGAAFLTGIVAPSKENRDALVRYVEMASAKQGLQYEEALQDFQAFADADRRPFLLETFFRELVAAGREANLDPTTNFQRGYAAIDALFPGSRNTAESEAPNPFAGDLKLAFSRIYTLSGGTISLLVPGGLVDVGVAVPPAVGAPARNPSDLGIVTQRAGDVRVFTNSDVLVNQSRIFTLGGGDIAIWSTFGDIDAGRGAKTAISAPAPTITVDDKGNVSVDLAGAVAGSGIRAILTDPDIEPGDVDLIAPAGIVNAGDAGIGSAGNLNVAAQQVVGLDNIQVGGASTGVPSETGNLGASLAGVSAVASSASSAADAALPGAGSANQTAAPLAESALGWLDVFIEGFGDDVCKANDEECLKRNRKP